MFGGIKHGKNCKKYKLYSKVYFTYIIMSAFIFVGVKTAEGSNWIERVKVMVPIIITCLIIYTLNEQLIKHQI